MVFGGLQEDLREVIDFTQHVALATRLLSVALR